MENEVLAERKRIIELLDGWWDSREDWNGDKFIAMVNGDWETYNSM
jgi:hypothetical protein